MEIEELGHAQSLRGRMGVFSRQGVDDQGSHREFDFFQGLCKAKKRTMEIKDQLVAQVSQQWHPTFSTGC